MKRPKHCYPKKPANSSVSTTKRWYKKLIWLFPLVWIQKYVALYKKNKEKSKRLLDLENHFNNRVWFNHHINSDLLGSWRQARRSPQDACVSKFLSQCPTADRLFSQIGRPLKGKANRAERDFIKYSSLLAYKSKINNHIFYLYQFLLVSTGIFSLLNVCISLYLDTCDSVGSMFSNTYCVIFSSAISIVLAIFASSYKISIASFLNFSRKSKNTKESILHLGLFGSLWWGFIFLAPIYRITDSDNFNYTMLFIPIVLSMPSIVLCYSINIILNSGLNKLTALSEYEERLLENIISYLKEISSRIQNDVQTRASESFSG